MFHIWLLIYEEINLINLTIPNKPTSKTQMYYKL